MLEAERAPAAVPPQFLGADQQSPSLFDPKQVALSAPEFGFIGYERHGQAWVLQQWDCELL